MHNRCLKASTKLNSQLHPKVSQKKPYSAASASHMWKQLLAAHRFTEIAHRFRLQFISSDAMLLHGWQRRMMLGSACRRKWQERMRVRCGVWRGTRRATFLRRAVVTIARASGRGRVPVTLGATNPAATKKALAMLQVPFLPLTGFCVGVDLLPACPYLR